MKQLYVDKLEVIASKTQRLIVFNALQILLLLQILKASINKTLSTVNRLEALNIPQTPIVNQMVVFNTQEIQTTNRLGRSKTLERPVKLLEGSDKPKIFQSHEAESLEQISTFPREESIVI